MVSNSLKMSQDEIIETLARVRREQAGDPAYEKLRADLPKDWLV